MALQHAGKPTIPHPSPHPLRTVVDAPVGDARVGERPRPRWTIVEYHLPSRPSGHRVAAWRELHRISGTNLSQGVWAVPHGEVGPPDLRPLRDIVESSGGRLHAYELSRTGPDADIERQLLRACDHLWDSFFNDVDRLQFRIAGGDRGDEAMHDLSELRMTYCKSLSDDVMDSEASARAAWRLRSCSLELIERDGIDRWAIAEDERTTRHRLVPQSEPVGLLDGTARSVLALSPFASPHWERAFHEFEVTTYLPAPDRVPFEHGAFVLRCPASDRPALAEKLAGRVRRFEQSLL